MSLSIDKGQEHADVDRLDGATSRDWQSLSIASHEDAMAAALVAPSNAVLPSHRLQVSQGPIEPRPAHGFQQLRSGVHTAMVLQVELTCGAG
jgi:hypothetical protein